MRSLVFGVLTFAVTLAQLTFGQQNTGHPATVLLDEEADQPTLPVSGVLSTLEKAWNEAIGTSVLACIIIMLPVTLCFLFCSCIICIYFKCSKSKSSRRDSSASSSRLGLKSRDGQLDPIPLTGLVHCNKSPSQGFLPLRPVVGRPTAST